MTAEPPPAARRSPFPRGGNRVILLALLALLPQLSVWNADFSYDDRVFVETNESLRSPGRALRALDESFPPGTHHLARYRPLTHLSYALQYALWGANPRGFHLANLLAYVLLVLGVDALGRRLLPTEAASLAFSALFAVHPVHVEAVSSVAGHSEVLAWGLGVGALLCFQNATSAPRGEGPGARSQRLRGFGWRGGTWICLALAALAKESAIVLPGVLLAHALIGPGPRTGSSAPGKPGTLSRVSAAAPFFGLVPLYAGLRFLALGRFGPELTVLGDLDGATRFWTVGRIALEYLRLLVWPHPLQVDYYYEHTVGVVDAPTAGSLAGWLCVSAAAAWSAVILVRLLASGTEARPGPWTRTALFGAIFALATLFPVSHAIPFGALMAERFLFAPSLGFLLACVAGAGHGAERLSVTPRALAAASVGLVAILAVVMADRSRDWRDEVTLWRALERRIQHDHRVYTNLAAGYLRRGDREAATRALEAALRLEPDHVAARNNLATVWLERGDFERAREGYQSVLELDPGNPVAWTNLGVIETRLLRHASALRCYRRARALEPKHAPAVAKLETAEAMVARAKDHLERHRGLEAESAAPSLLLEQALAHHVLGHRGRARALYAVLFERTGGGERWRVPALESELPPLFETSALSEAPAAAARPEAGGSG